MHRLQIIRESFGLSVKDLSVLSDISKGAIYRIESEDSLHKTNETTALALASALDVEVSDLFDPTELTHIGRHAHTGKPIVKLRLVKSHEIQCRCGLIVPRAIGCDTCDDAVA